VSVRLKVRDTAPNVAVSVAVTSAATAAAVAVNVAVVAAAGTVTEGGTVTLALLLASVTDMPPAEAGRVNVTVHVEVPGPCTEAGVQDKLLSCGVATWLIVTVPLPPVDAKPVAFPSAAEVPFTRITDDVAAVEAEMLNVAVATTPLAIAV
jgi:hypothetical protein